MPLSADALLLQNWLETAPVCVAANIGLEAQATVFGGDASRTEAAVAELDSIAHVAMGLYPAYITKDEWNA